MSEVPDRGNPETIVIIRAFPGKKVAADRGPVWSLRIIMGESDIEQRTLQGQLMAFASRDPTDNPIETLSGRPNSRETAFVDIGFLPRYLY
jgi:hypothetical protein